MVLNIFGPICGILGPFSADTPPKRPFEVSGLERLETPVNGGSGRRSLMIFLARS